MTKITSSYHWDWDFDVFYKYIYIFFLSERNFANKKYISNETNYLNVIYTLLFLAFVIIIIFFFLRLFSLPLLNA